MEVNVTSLVEDNDPREFSNSRFESGLDNIGEITWAAACEYAANNPLCTTADQLAELADYFASFGAWDRDEIDAMSATELNALLVQSVAGDLNESTHFDTFEEYSEQVGGRLCPSDDGWYYYVGA